MTQSINLISGEAKELVKPFIHDRPEYSFTNAVRLLEKQYGNPQKPLASYIKEIKHITKIKSSDPAYEDETPMRMRWLTILFFQA